MLSHITRFVILLTICCYFSGSVYLSTFVQRSHDLALLNANGMLVSHKLAQVEADMNRKNVTTSQVYGYLKDNTGMNKKDAVHGVKSKSPR